MSQAMLVKDGNYNVRLRIDGNVVKNENYQVLARIDGDQIKDGNHKVIARIDGDQIKDGNYNVIGRLDGKLQHCRPPRWQHHQGQELQSRRQDRWVPKEQAAHRHFVFPRFVTPGMSL